MSVEKDLSTRILMGQQYHQSGDDEPQYIDFYQLPPNLPGNTRKRDICFEHFDQGAASELMGDFDMGGARTPNHDEPQEITVQLSCKGVGCVLKKCGLKVEQFDATGQKIGEMKAL